MNVMITQLGLTIDDVDLDWTTVDLLTRARGSVRTMTAARRRSDPDGVVLVSDRARDQALELGWPDVDIETAVGVAPPTADLIERGRVVLVHEGGLVLQRLHAVDDTTVGYLELRASWDDLGAHLRVWRMAARAAKSEPGAWLRTALERELVKAGT